MELVLSKQYKEATQAYVLHALCLIGVRVEKKAHTHTHSQCIKQQGQP